MREEKAGQLSSIDLARRIEGWRDSGKRECRFLIGAADGFDDAERDNADLLIAFGAMTWPHMMARAMLAEQLWRACSNLAGHPYHRQGCMSAPMLLQGGWGNQATGGCQSRISAIPRLTY